MIHTGQNCDGNLSDYLKRYRYQSELTAHLDTLPDELFSQETVNEIVVWKVNRYVRVAQGMAWICRWLPRFCVFRTLTYSRLSTDTPTVRSSVSHTLCIHRRPRKPKCPLTSR
jgi:hypothetical protein